MGSVIKKVANTHGEYRYIPSIDVVNYPSVDWEHDPDISGVQNVNRRFWKYDGTAIVAEMSGAEKDALINSTADHSNAVLAGTMGFEKSNSCRNKWLGFGASKFSNTTPFVVPCPMQVTAITFINSANSVETDIEVYKNGSLEYTWEVRDKRWAWNTEGLSKISFIPGDRVGVFMRDRGTNAYNTIITLHYATSLHRVGAGGSSTL